MDSSPSVVVVPVPDGAAAESTPPAAEATATAVPVHIMLPALITHLDALAGKYKTGSGDTSKTTSLIGRLNKDKNVLACMQTALEGRDHVTIKALNTALSSKEAVMENLGFGAAFDVTEKRPGGRSGGGPHVKKEVLEGQLEDRFATIAKHAAARALKVTEAGRSRGRLPYPLSHTTAKALMRDANHDGRAPGVVAAVQLPKDALRQEDIMKLAQICSACVYLRDPPQTTDGSPIVADRSGVFPALPALVVDMDELYALMREVYINSDKGTHSTSHALTPMSEALWWACFVMPSNQAWASRYMSTEEHAQAQTQQRSTDEPVMSRQMAVSAFNAVRTDPEDTVHMAVKIAMRHPAEFEEHLVPVYGGSDAESEEGMEERLTAAFTKAAVNMPMATEAILNACMSARGGPLSPVLQHYAQSGAAADWNPATFCANRQLPPGRERAMFVYIMTALDVFGGGIAGGSLWKVVNRTSDDFTANDDPDQPPLRQPPKAKPPKSNASAKRPASRASGDSEGEEEDSSQNAEYEIAAAARAIKRKYQSSPGAGRSADAQKKIDAREKLSRIKEAISSLLAVKERDGTLDEGRNERLRKLRETETTLEMDVTADLI